MERLTVVFQERVFLDAGAHTFDLNLLLGVSLGAVNGDTAHPIVTLLPRFTVFGLLFVLGLLPFLNHRRSGTKPSRVVAERKKRTSTSVRKHVEGQHTMRNQGSHE